MGNHRTIILKRGLKMEGLKEGQEKEVLKDFPAKPAGTGVKTAAVPIPEKTEDEKRIEFFEKIGLKIRKEKMSKESATLNFDAILYKYDIDFKDIVNERGREGAETIRNKFVRAFMYGRMDINLSSDPEKGFQIIQNLSTGKTVAYNEYNTTAAEESDKGVGSSEQQYQLLGSLCGKSAEYIKSKSNFRGEDLRLAECIALLFFL